MSELAPATAPAETRAVLDRRVLAWIEQASAPDVIGEPTGWQDDGIRFGELALALFRFQFDNCEAYARFCDASGVDDPSALDDWRSIPAVPTGAFKETRLACFPTEETRAVFRTSGTSTQQRGELHLDSLELYEASLLASLRRFFVPATWRAAVGAGAAQPLLRFLAPSPSRAPDSSLSHMFGALATALGQDPNAGFDVVDGEIDFASFEAFLDESCGAGRPVALCGTAFAFVHWLDALARRGHGGWRLPVGSRLLETGGFKGRSREISRQTLHSSLGKATGLEECAIVNQYGMTELGSQFYDSVFVDRTGPRRKLRPPWVRVRRIHPQSGREAAPDEAGLLVIHDLANTGSVAAIQTADLARAVAADGSEWGEGFDVLGRAQGAEARGCSIAADAMFSRSLNAHEDDGAEALR